MIHLLTIMVQGFQPHMPNYPFFETGSINRGVRSSSGVTRAATIYSWDDADERTSTCYSSDERSTMDPIVSHSDVTELLRHDQEKIATLARLAATHCQDSSLILENIQDVHVLSVDNEHIEISAIMCDDESCVTVLVPVKFLNPCNMEDDSSLTECILDNILDLDELALQAIQHKHLCNEMESDDVLMKEYFSESLMSYPTWWISATEMMNTVSTSSYSNPCSLDKNSSLKVFQDMKSFLNNENFEEEIKSFGRKLMLSNGYGRYELLRARVTEVGPLGFCLRAMVLDKTSSQEQGFVTDVYHQFDEYASDADSLRRSVLAAFQ